MVRLALLHHHHHHHATVVLTNADTDGSAKVCNAANKFTKLLNDTLSMDLEIL